MSEFSGRAFGPSASLAKSFEAELYLVHQGLLTLFSRPKETDEYFSDLEKHLVQLAKSPEFEGLSVTPHLVRGGNVVTLREALDDYDLVVAATHGRTGLKRMVLGSFAEKLVRVSGSPILVSRSNGGTFEPRRILVAHDFSKPTTTSVELAYEWAKKFSAEVKILTVVDTQQGVTGFQAEFLRSWGEYYDLVRQDALGKLQKIADEERWQDLLLEIDVADGDPAQRILEESKNFDLVVVGRHGHLYMERLFLGHVAEKVVRSVECSVLVVEHLA